MNRSPPLTRSSKCHFSPSIHTPHPRPRDSGTRAILRDCDARAIWELNRDGQHRNRGYRYTCSISQVVFVPPRYHLTGTAIEPEIEPTWQIASDGSIAPIGCRGNEFLNPRNLCFANSVSEGSFKVAHCFSLKTG